VNAASGFHIDGNHLTLQGLCEACSVEEPSQSEEVR
jgi:hypothetical protein